MALVMEREHTQTIDTEQAVDRDREAPLVQENQAERLRASDFWLGVVATENQIVMEPEAFKNAQILRGVTYIDELKWLPETARDSEGRENDSYDHHSEHVVVVDNRLGSATDPSVFANVRYIHRENLDGRLPVEEEYNLKPGLLAENAVEFSRFISRHPDGVTRSLGSIALASYTVGTLNRLNLMGYAIIEESLVKHLKRMGLAIDIITEEKKLKSYGETVNFGVRIHGEKSLARAKAIARKQPKFPFGRFFDIATNGTNQEVLLEIGDYLGVGGATEEAA